MPTVNNADWGYTDEIINDGVTYDTGEMMISFKNMEMPKDSVANNEVSQL